MSRYVDGPPGYYPQTAVPESQTAACEYVDETPRRPRRTAQEITAEDALGHHFVSVLSVAVPVPRYWGDNLGMLPVWVESNADWRQSGVAFDRQQPALRAIRIAVLGVASAAHAVRLKGALDEALHGCESRHDADPLRHRFRNGVEFGDVEAWWTPLLLDALMRCQLAARDFDVFSRADHEEAVRRRMAQGRKVLR